MTSLYCGNKDMTSTTHCDIPLPLQKGQHKLGMRAMGPLTNLELCDDTLAQCDHSLHVQLV